MTSGTVRIFSESQGFGWIAPDAGARDVLVHVSTLEQAGIARLEHGQRVQFELFADRHGQAAAARISLI